MAKLKTIISKNSFPHGQCRTCFHYMIKGHGQEKHSIVLKFESQEDSDHYFQSLPEGSENWHSHELEAGFKLCKDHLKEIIEQLKSNGFEVKLGKEFEMEYSKISILGLIPST